LIHPVRMSPILSVHTLTVTWIWRWGEIVSYRVSLVQICLQWRSKCHYLRRVIHHMQ
jgi:hypothetical protein